MIDTFTVARRTLRVTRESFERLNSLKDTAREHNVNLRTHADRTRLDLLAASEAAKLQRKYDRLGFEPVTEAVDAIRRASRRDRDEEKPDLGRYLDLPLKQEVGFFQEEGDLVLGIPFAESARSKIRDEREIVAGALSAIARYNITLDEPEDGFYLALGSTKANRSSDEALDAVEIAAEKLFWPSDGTEAIVAVAGLFDAEVYEERALLRSTNQD